MRVGGIVIGVRTRRLVIGGSSNLQWLVAVLGYLIRSMLALNTLLLLLYIVLKFHFLRTVTTAPSTATNIS